MATGYQRRPWASRPIQTSVPNSATWERQVVNRKKYRPTERIFGRDNSWAHPVGCNRKIWSFQPGHAAIVVVQSVFFNPFGRGGVHPKQRHDSNRPLKFQPHGLKMIKCVATLLYLRSQSIRKQSSSWNEPDSCTDAADISFALLLTASSLPAQKKKKKNKSEKRCLSVSWDTYFQKNDTKTLVNSPCNCRRTHSRLCGDKRCIFRSHAMQQRARVSLLPTDSAMCITNLVQCSEQKDRGRDCWVHTFDTRFRCSIRSKYLLGRVSEPSFDGVQRREVKPRGEEEFRTTQCWWQCQGHQHESKGKRRF